MQVKTYFQKASEKFYRYYRLLYSIFSFVTLLILLIYQYSFTSIILIQSIFVKYLAVFILVIPGLLIMILSIFKYFRLLSGIRSLYEPVPPVTLRIDGIHKYVRHPLYTGTLLFTWGLFLIFPFLNNLIAVIIITLYVLVGIKFEEKKLLLEFGNSYKNYSAKVPMLIPNFKLSRK